MKFIAFFAFALLGVSAAASSQEMVGDPKTGEQLAIDICADCHAVGPAPDIMSTNAPRSFVVIANDPKYTPTSLRVFLRTPHKDMPDFILTETQTDDIVAYIFQLKR